MNNITFFLVLIYLFISSCNLQDKKEYEYISNENTNHEFIKKTVLDTPKIDRSFKLDSIISIHLKDSIYINWNLNCHCFSDNLKNILKDSVTIIYLIDNILDTSLTNAYTCSSYRGYLTKGDISFFMVDVLIDLPIAIIFEMDLGTGPKIDCPLSSYCIDRLHSQRKYMQNRIKNYYFGGQNIEVLFNKPLDNEEEKDTKD